VTIYDSSSFGNQVQSDSSSRLDLLDGRKLPPLFKIEMGGAENTLSIEFERYVSFGELNWFLSELQSYRFVTKSSSFSSETEKRLPTMHTLYGGEVSPQLVIKRFRLKVRITFQPHITNASGMPEFVRIFSGLDKGRVPTAPKRMSTWHRLRKPLV
jgi:hypothetical protein